MAIWSILTKSEDRIPTLRSAWVNDDQQEEKLKANEKTWIERERKHHAKKEKEAKEEEIATVEELVQSVLKAVSQEEFPESAEDKEKYFMEQVGIGEELCKNGNYIDIDTRLYYDLIRWVRRGLLWSKCHSLLQGSQDLPCSIGADYDLSKDSSWKSVPYCG